MSTNKSQNAVLASKVFHLSECGESVHHRPHCIALQLTKEWVQNSQPNLLNWGLVHEVSGLICIQDAFGFWQAYNVLVTGQVLDIPLRCLLGAASTQQRFDKFMAGGHI